MFSYKDGTASNSNVSSTSLASTAASSCPVLYDDDNVKITHRYWSDGVSNFGYGINIYVKKGSIKIGKLMQSTTSITYSTLSYTGSWNSYIPYTAGAMNQLVLFLYAN